MDLSVSNPASLSALETHKFLDRPTCTREKQFDTFSSRDLIRAVTAVYNVVSGHCMRVFNSHSPSSCNFITAARNRQQAPPPLRLLGPSSQFQLVNGSTAVKSITETNWLRRSSWLMTCCHAHATLTVTVRRSPLPVTITVEIK